MQPNSTQERLLKIFHPHFLKELSKIQKDPIPFVHYTRAEAAMKILQTGEIWMRKSFCMNDYSEVLYGLESLKKAWESENGRKLKSRLESIFSGASEGTEEFFSQAPWLLSTNTYLACISEHDEERENELGRLSMWRAYGDTTGVALVLNSKALISSTVERVFTSPVAYFSPQEVEEEIGKIANAIQEESSFLQEQGEEELKVRISNMLVFAAVCLKHRGFKEEKEWRVIFIDVPGFAMPTPLTKEIQAIGGVPQSICKINLKKVPGATVPELIDRIIIGPTKHPPLALQEAFIRLLEEAQVKEAEKKVILSQIPLRQ